MGRSKKMKKVRTLDDMYKGDSKHDDAPMRESEREILLEKRKFEAKLRKEQRLIEGRQRVRESKKNEAESHLSDLKLKPNESLRSFNDRVDTRTRLLQAAQAKMERNQRRKQKKAEKEQARRTGDDEDAWGKVGDSADEADDASPSRKRSLPRFLDVAERPPELQSISNNKKRFVELAATNTSSKEQQMAAMLERVQGLYKKKT